MDALTCAVVCAALRRRVARQGRGLPSGVLLHDLVASKTAPIPPTHDEGNPELGCEFFETRQVRRLPHLHAHCHLCWQPVLPLPCGKGREEGLVRSQRQQSCAILMSQGQAVFMPLASYMHPCPALTEWKVNDNC